MTDLARPAQLTQDIQLSKGSVLAKHAQVITYCKKMDIALVVLFGDTRPLAEENARLTNAGPTRNWNRVVAAPPAQHTLDRLQAKNVELNAHVSKL